MTGPIEQAKASGAPFPLVACERCGREFQKRTDWARFCSDRCRTASHEVERAKRMIARHLATVSEAAQIAGVHASTIRKWVKRGKLRGDVFMGRILISRRDIKSRL